MSAKPLISIGMPVHNGQAYVGQAVESILSQTCADFELIISDNASDDATREICDELARRDSRVQYHRQPVNIGAAANFNFTFWQSRGRYFKWAAHDDLLEPRFLERCLACLRAAGEGASLAYADRQVILPDGRPVRVNRTVREVLGLREHRRLTLADVLRLPGDWFPPLIFGLIDARLLRRTRLMQAYPSADLVLTAELRMLGTFAEVGERLYIQRRHAATPGWQQRATRAGEAAWYNPSQRNGGISSAGLFFEHVRAIGHLPLSWDRRCGAYAAMPVYVGARLRRLLARRALMRRMREEMAPHADPPLYGVRAEVGAHETAGDR